MRAEGVAMRAGPRPRLEAGLVSVLREAIRAERVVEFSYLAQSTGRRSRQRVQPYGGALRQPGVSGRAQRLGQ